MDFIYGICSFMIVTIIFILIPLFLKYVTIKLAINNERKEKLAPIDFSKEKGYYREILKTYTPAEISYIDDFKINTKREIVTTLLNLELKKRIKLMPN